MADVTFDAPAWVTFRRADGALSYGVYRPDGWIVDLPQAASSRRQASPPSLLALVSSGPQEWLAADELVAAVSDPVPGVTFDLSDVRLSAPLPAPRMMLGIGGNYPAYEKTYTHIVPRPRVFQKPVSTLCGPDESIVLPKGIAYVQPELELCAIIGREIRHASVDEARDAIFGYTIGNDVTAVDPLMTDWVWRDRPEAETFGLPTRTPLSFGLAFHSKAYDTFAPMGPGIVRTLDVEAGVSMQLSINGEVAQQADTSDMLVAVPDLIAWISSVCTLQPGDVVWTGAPPNLPALNAGDELRHTITGIGSFAISTRQEEE